MGVKLNLRTIAIKNIKLRKGKVALIIAGLSLAVAALVSITSILTAFQRGVDERLNEYGFNILVFPKTSNLSLTYGGMTLAGVAPSEVKYLSQRDVSKIGKIPRADQIRMISPKVIQIARIKGRDTLVGGIIFSKELKVKKWWQIDSGVFPRKPNEVLAGINVAEKLKIAREESISINGENFKVAGILFETGSQDDNLIFIQIDKLREVFGLKDEVNFIEVATKSSGSVEPVSQEISKALASKQPTVTSLKQAIKFKENAVSQLAKFGLGITAIIVLISALIVFITMASSVNERRREIGIFRAIGYRQSKIARIILTEALLLSLTSGIGGFFLGTLLAQILPVVSSQLDVKVQPNFILLFFSLALAVMIGLLASLVPAWRGANLDPVEALKEL